MNQLRLPVSLLKKKRHCNLQKEQHCTPFPPELHCSYTELIDFNYRSENVQDRNKTKKSRVLGQKIIFSSSYCLLKPRRLSTFTNTISRTAATCHSCSTEDRAGSKPDLLLMTTLQHEVCVTYTTECFGIPGPHPLNANSNPHPILPAL